MAGSFIDRTDPTFVDLRRREVVKVRCGCGREVQIPPERLIGFKGITQHTKVWSLRDRFRCTKCRRRPPKRMPKRMWIDKWRD